MRISVNGFGKFADTLHIGIPKHADWEAFKNVLSIGGVTYFYAEGCTIGVRYNGAVDPIDVAAQALIVAAAFCGTPVDEMEVVVEEHFNDVDESKVAAEVQSRMLTMPAPAEVSLDRVVMRGEGPPAYWLK